WRNAADYAVHHLEVLAAAELVARLAEQHDEIALRHQAATHDGPGVLDYANHTDERRRQDRASIRLVVQTHIPAGDRDVEPTARRPHPLHRTCKLPPQCGVLRIAEVETVGRANRQRSRTRHVARRFRYRQLRSAIRIEVDEPAIAVNRHRQRT